MEVTILRSNGQLILPAAIREATCLKEGDPLEITIVPEGILLKTGEPIDPEQAWFWTPEWQEGEREASEDIAAGRVTVYMSDEEFLAAVDE
ncbi:MAG: AbrB/MazE/SpoVT family DNA-binding domain-containing protein [Dehalococcoidia bacterium]